MKIVLLILASILLSCSLQAGIAKSFPHGYILCVYDRPATINNHGSKLVVGLQKSRHTLLDAYVVGRQFSQPQVAA